MSNKLKSLQLSIKKPYCFMSVLSGKTKQDGRYKTTLKKDGVPAA